MICSGKGGVGKTNTTSLLGKEFSRMEKTVVLIDADFGLRNLDIQFSIEDKILYNIADLLNGVCSWKQACIRLQDSLYLIPGTKNATFFCGQSMFHRVLNELQEVFDYILIDTPAGITNVHRALLPLVDEGIIVFTWDKSSISDALSMSHLLQEENIPIYSILNQSKPLYRRIYRDPEIHETCNTLLQSKYLGMIPFIKNPKGGIRDIRRICDQL